MPRGATCSRPSKPITIVGRSTPLSVTSPHSRQTGKPHNPVSTVPGEGQTYTVADRRRSGKTSTPGGLTPGHLKPNSNLHQLDGRSRNLRQALPVMRKILIIAAIVCGALAAGAATGQTVTTGDSVTERCDYSAPIDDPAGYYRTCIDATTGTLKLDGTKSPPRNTLKIELDRQVYDVPASAAIVGSDVVVSNNNALKLAVGAAGKRLVRLGFWAAGDGGIATYNWSADNCTAADNGAQVQPRT